MTEEWGAEDALAEEWGDGDTVELSPPDANGQRPEQEKIGFLKRVGEDLDKRRELYWGITDAYLNGEQSYAEGMLQVAGKVGAGAILDVMGEVVISAGRGLSTITPDMIEDPIRGGATRVAHEFLNTRVGQSGLEAARDGIEAWGGFKEKNPRAARNIEAVVDIAMLTAPVKGKPKANPSIVGRTGDKLVNSADDLSARNRAESVESLVSPKKTKKVREAEVPRTSEEGILKQKTVAPTIAEKEMAEEVLKIPQVKKKNTIQANYSAIANEVTKESERLKSALEKNDFVVPRSELIDDLNGVAARLADNPTIVGDPARSAQKIVEKAKAIADLQKSSGSGLLAARKELDAWVRSQKGANAFDPAMENAMTVALREVRQTINTFIADRAPTVPVKQSLKKQSTLLKAMDNIAPKAADEAANILLRAWHRGLKLLPLRGEFNQAMAAAFGIGGLGASALFAPMFTKLALSGIAGIAVYKTATGPTSRKALGQVLSGMDEMIRTTRDQNLIRELRADRAMLIEISESAKSEITDE